MVSIVIIVEDSGTGYICYFLLLTTYVYRKKILRYLAMPLLFGGMCFIVVNNLLTKISVDYLTFLYKFTMNIITVHYVNHINSVWDVLFGVDVNYDFPIDFCPFFLIAKVGLLYFILYSIAIMYLFYKQKNMYFRMAIVSLLFVNLHYPALFYPIMNALLPTLMIYHVNGLKYIKI